MVKSQMGSAKVCLRGQQKVLVGNAEVSQMWHFKDFRRRALPSYGQ